MRSPISHQVVSTHKADAPPDRMIVVSRGKEDVSYLSIFLPDVPHTVYQVGVPVLVPVAWASDNIRKVQVGRYAFDCDGRKGSDTYISSPVLGCKKH